jgi:hypothetical protein
VSPAREPQMNCIHPAEHCSRRTAQLSALSQPTICSCSSVEHSTTGKGGLQHAHMIAAEQTAGGVQAPALRNKKLGTWLGQTHYALVHSLGRHTMPWFIAWSRHIPSLGGALTMGFTAAH